MNRFAYIMTLFIAGCSNDGSPSGDAQVSNDPQGVITFTSDRDGNYEIYSLDLQTNDLVRLTDHPETDYYSCWTPDGAQIAFYSTRNGNADLYLMDHDGTQIRQVTKHEGHDALPSVSPDGQKVAFVSQRDTIGRNLFIINVDGSNVRQLTSNSDYEESPSWSPDGKHLLFTRQLRIEGDTSHAANGEIFKYDLSSGEETRMTKKPGFDSGARYSPDGKQIAFYGLENDLFNIYLMNADGTNLTNLTNDTTECYSPAWSPDGSWIAYTGGNASNYELWIINVRTGEKRQITYSEGRDQNPSWKK